MPFIPLILAIITLAIPAAARAATAAGRLAPDFTATDILGQNVTLSALKGKPVVLEWTNHECPFVRKQYDTGNMQATQKKAEELGATWISIVSSAEGKEGFVTPEQASAIVKKEGASPTYKILDPKGEIGKLYGAKTTPHMFVIDKDGTLAYAGAIDSDSSFRPDSVKTATNYVLAALEDLKAGKPVATAQTEPYGCSVKY